MDVIITGLPDDMTMQDLATRLYRQFGDTAEAEQIEPEQDEKPLHVQVAEVLRHIHNHDYGLAESKARLLRDQLQKGNWVLGAGTETDSEDDGFVRMCCDATDFSGECVDVIITSRGAQHNEDAAPIKERTCAFCGRDDPCVICGGDWFCDVRCADNYIDKDTLIKDLEAKIRSIRNSWLISCDDVHALEEELSTCKHDSEVFMQVVEIVKTWDDSTGRAFPTLYQLVDLLVDYTDTPEERVG